MIIEHQLSTVRMSGKDKRNTCVGSRIKRMGVMCHQNLKRIRLALSQEIMDRLRNQLVSFTDSTLFPAQPE